MRRILSAVFVVAMAAMLVACSKGGGASLTLKRAQYQPGEVISVVYKAPEGLPSNAWVGIIPSDIAHGKETLNDQHDISYKYLSGSSAGEMVFNAPEKPGRYDFRLHDTDSDGKELASVTFAVAGAQAEPEKAEPEKAAAAYKVGDTVMIEWKGSWYPGSIIQVREGGSPYKIHYDGYSNSWDEWVTVARLKNK